MGKDLHVLKNLLDVPRDAPTNTVAIGIEMDVVHGEFEK